MHQKHFIFPFPLSLPSIFLNNQQSACTLFLLWSLLNFSFSAFLILGGINTHHMLTSTKDRYRDCIQWNVRGWKQLDESNLCGTHTLVAKQVHCCWPVRGLKDMTASNCLPASNSKAILVLLLFSSIGWESCSDCWLLSSLTNPAAVREECLKPQLHLQFPSPEECRRGLNRMHL